MSNRKRRNARPENSHQPQPVETNPLAAVLADVRKTRDWWVSFDAWLAENGFARMSGMTSDELSKYHAAVVWAADDCRRVRQNLDTCTADERANPLFPEICALAEDAVRVSEEAKQTVSVVARLRKGRAETPDELMNRALRGVDMTKLREATARLRATMSAQTLPETQDDEREAAAGKPQGKFSSELDAVFGSDAGNETEKASIEELFENYWNNNQPAPAHPEPTHPSSQDTSTRWEHRGDGILRASWDVTGGPVTAEVEFLSPEGPMRLTMTHQGRVVHEEEYTDHLDMMEEADRVAAGVDQMESDAAFEAQLAEFEAEHERDQAAFEAEMDALAAAEERRDAAMFTALDRAAARPEWSLSEGANKALLEAMDGWAGEPVTMNDPVGFELALVALGQRIASGTLTDEDRRLAAEVVALVRPEMEAAGLFDPMPGEDEKLAPDPWGAPAAGDEERPAPTQADRERVAMAWVQRLETCVALAEARLRRLVVERNVARAVAASLEDGPEATSLRGVLQKATAVMDADPSVVSARAEFDTVLAEYEAGAAERAKARLR